MSCLGRSDSPGFSLFEILAVLVLFGLAAALIMPSFTGGFSSLELETAGRDLVTRMKQSRSEAIARQSVFRIVFKSGEGKNSYALTDAFEAEIRNFDLPKGVTFQLPEGQREEGPFKVSFYPNGRSSGGELALVNDRGKRVEIEIDPITGFAKVRDLKEEEK